MEDGKAIRILYMEDDPGLARLFQKKFSKLDYEVVVAEDGKMGLNCFDQGAFDVLVIDYQMPEFDGLQVLQKIRERGSLTAVIMLTGAGTEEVAVEAMKMGASDYILKDFDGKYFDLLPVTIEEAVKRTRLAQEKKRMQLELKHYAEELERSNKELQQFAYVVSHDLKEPLHTIRGFAKYLEETYSDKLDTQGGEFIAYIIEGSIRMERLIEGLLDYSRVKFSEIVLKSVNCDNLVKQVVHDLKATIEERKAVVCIDKLPTVKGNERMLTRVFQNLIDNALKYCRNKPPKVHVSAVQESGEWQFSIKDNGIGINPKFNEKVFRIFHRLHSRKEFKGDGLGLAICKKIIESHNGKIWFQSKPDNGATFYFTIPKSNNKSK